MTSWTKWMWMRMEISSRTHRRNKANLEWMLLKKQRPLGRSKITPSNPKGSTWLTRVWGIKSWFRLNLFPSQMVKNTRYFTQRAKISSFSYKRSATQNHLWWLENRFYNLKDYQSWPIWILPSFWLLFWSIARRTKDSNLFVKSWSRLSSKRFTKEDRVTVTTKALLIYRAY